MNKLQPEDYASLSLLSAQLKEHIIRTCSFEELMDEERLPGYSVELELKISVVAKPTGDSVGESTLTLSIDQTDLPSGENDDDVPC